MFTIFSVLWTVFVVFYCDDVHFCNTLFEICVIGFDETVLVFEVVFLERVLLIPEGAIEIWDIRISNEEIVTNCRL